MYRTLLVAYLSVGRGSIRRWIRPMKWDWHLILKRPSERRLCRAVNLHRCGKTQMLLPHSHPHGYLNCPLQHSLHPPFPTPWNGVTLCLKDSHQITTTLHSPPTHDRISSLIPPRSWDSWKSSFGLQQGPALSFFILS